MNHLRVKATIGEEKVHATFWITMGGEEREVGTLAFEALEWPIFRELLHVPESLPDDNLGAGIMLEEWPEVRP